MEKLEVGLWAWLLPNADFCTLWRWVCLRCLVAQGLGLGPRPKSALEPDLSELNPAPFRGGVGKLRAPNSVAARSQNIALSLSVHAKQTNRFFNSES